MADREAQQKLYAYSEMSNKVQKADRSQRRSRGGDGTGEVESLRGRNNVGRMGDRVAASASMKQERPAELEDRMKKAKKKRQKREGVGMGDRCSKKHNILMSSGGQSTLDMGELNVYQPTHAGSRASYESVLVRMIKCNTLSDAIQIQSWKSTNTFPACTYLSLHYIHNTALIQKKTSNMSSNTDEFTLTPYLLKKRIIHGRVVDFFNGLDYGDHKKVKDHHVMDVLTNHVRADQLRTIGLGGCISITNATLIQIINMCPQLQMLDVNFCEMITDDGIIPIAEKYGQQLKILSYDECTKCTDAALESIVSHCNQLEELGAKNCGITTIPENIGFQLTTNLKYLNLSCNKITKIPLSLSVLIDTLETLNIEENPLQQPPSDIANQGLLAITMYFEEIQEKGSAM